MEKINETNATVNQQTKSIQRLLIIGVLSIMYACTSSGEKSYKSQYADSVTVSTDNLLKEKDQNDSLSNVVATRKIEEFTGTIFGGIKFGMNESIYNNAIREYNRKFNNQIYIPTNDNEVNIIPIESITPSFFHNKLYKLDILIASSSAKSALEELFISKYGITKQSLWKYQNATIELKQVYNVEYNPRKEAGYASTNLNIRMYWASDSRGSGAPITRDPAYTHIVYTDDNLEQLVRKEIIHQDSILKEKTKRVKLSDRNKAIIQVDNI